MTGRRRSPLPRGITRAEARALLGCCDRRSALGRRDYAHHPHAAAAGLAPSEVAGLRLDDIDWRAGELVVRGQGRSAGPAAAARRRRRGDRRLPAARAPGQRPAGGVPAGPGAVRSDRAGHGRLDRAAGLPAGRGGRGRRAPAAPHRGLRDGRGGRAAGPDRAGAAPPQPADHGDLRPRRPRSAAAGCAQPWPGGAQR